MDSGNGSGEGGLGGGWRQEGQGGRGGGGRGGGGQRMRASGKELDFNQVRATIIQQRVKLDRRQDPEMTLPGDPGVVKDPRQTAQINKPTRFKCPSQLWRHFRLISKVDKCATKQNVKQTRPESHAVCPKRKFLRQSLLFIGQ